MRILCLWSGGLDSTYMLKKLSKEGHQVTAGWVKIKNNKEKNLREEKAREAIIDTGFLSKYDIIYESKPLSQFSLGFRNQQLMFHQVTPWLIGLIERKERDWSTLSRRIHKFDDSHVDAYKRGLEDAISSLKQMHFECYDYYPKIGQWIDVGACCGTVTDITETVITVSGVYTYPDDSPNPHREAWRFNYLIEDAVEHVTAKRISRNPNRYGGIIWDFENVPRVHN